MSEISQVQVTYILYYVSIYVTRIESRFRLNKIIVTTTTQTFCITSSRVGTHITDVVRLYIFITVNHKSCVFAEKKKKLKY